VESLAFALAAGMLAAVNPCGFAMLPAYLSLFTLGGAGAQRTRPAAIVRAMTATLAMTAGFLAVFATFGLALAPIASIVQRWLPAVTIGIGVALAASGLILLTGRTVKLTVPLGRLAVDPASSTLAMGLYGVAYAIASLGCTIGPFLVVTATTFRTGDMLTGVLAYVAYAGGMGLVVGVLAIGAALASDTAAHALRRSLPWMGRASGALLAVVGAYVAWYGGFELRVYAGGDTDDPIVNAAERIQAPITHWIEATDPRAWAVVLAAVVVLAGAGWWWARRRVLNRR